MVSKANAVLIGLVVLGLTLYQIMMFKVHKLYVPATSINNNNNNDFDNGVTAPIECNLEHAMAMANSTTTTTAGTPTTTPLASYPLSVSQPQSSSSSSSSPNNNNNNNNNNNSNNNNILYHTTPNTFITALTTCIVDSNCHVLFQHVGKTGGKGLERLLNSIVGEQWDAACCGEKMLERFRADTHKFCSKQFSSYEVVYGFEEIVETCKKNRNDHNNTIQNNKNNNNTQTTTLATNTTTTSSPSSTERYLVLTSLREPIERTLSSIHQTCNKAFGHRPNRTKMACFACSFEYDEELWMEFVNITHTEYATLREQGMMMMMPSVNDNNNNNNNNHDNNHHNNNNLHLWIDMMDLTPMVHDLRVSFSQHYPQLRYHQHKSFIAYTTRKKNPEKLHRCEFGMHSKMIKGLRPISAGFYRNFLMGRIG